jgi:glycine betaine/choline ABC-type transport system substrate-binding protein
MLLAGTSFMSHGASTSKSVDAYLRYTGAYSYINNAAKTAQNQASKDTQFYLGGAFYVGNTIAERKITLTWTFP